MFGLTTIISLAPILLSLRTSAVDARVVHRRDYDSSQYATAAGCYYATNPGYAVHTTSTTQTQDTCISSCAAKGYAYAGLNLGTECYCANQLTAASGQQVATSYCSTACAGDKTTTCGGPTNYYQVFYANAAQVNSNGAIYTSTSSAAAASSASASASSASVASVSSSKAAASSASVAAASSSSAAAASSSSAAASSSSAAAASSSSAAAASSSSAAASSSSAAAAASSSKAAASASSASVISASSASVASASSASVASVSSASAASVASIASASSASVASASSASVASASSASAASVSSASAASVASIASASSASVASASQASVASASSASAASVSSASAASAASVASVASASSASVAQASQASAASASSASVASASQASVASASQASAASASQASAAAASSASVASASSASVASASSASVASVASASAAASASVVSASSASVASASSASAASSASVASVASASSASVASVSSASVASVSSASASSASASSASAAAAASSASAFAAQATALASGWQVASSGCIAEGKGGRALVDNSIFGGMTWKTCTTFCDGKGFTLAGVEYGRECYCGNVLSNGASLNIASSSCNMPCDGNNNTNCGGYSSLKLFASSSAISLLSADLTSQSIAIPNGWSVASNDCIQEGSSGRALVGASYSADGMTVPSCINYCDGLNYPYAGVEYGRECYCGNTLSNGASMSISGVNQCSIKCQGNTATTCGGSNAMQLYVNPTNFVNTTNVNGYTYQGCYAEVAGRALTGASFQSTSMTIETCTAYCSNQGFTMSGVEYGKECYCGNSLSNGAGASSSACGYSCAGSSQETCGGYNALGLYKSS